MRRLQSILLLAAVPLLFGCEFPVRSLYPLYNDENLINDSRIVGRWKDKDSTETWEFSTAGNKAYNCVVRDNDGRPARFEARVMDLRGRMFLNFFPAELNGNVSPFVALHLWPVHTFAFLETSESTLQLRFPDNNWLVSLLSENPGAIRHESLGERDIVLSASTETLQQFWMEHLDTEDALMEPIQLQRIAEHSP